VRHMHAAMGRGRVDPNPLAPINTVSKGEERGKEKKKEIGEGPKKKKTERETTREWGERQRLRERERQQFFFKQKGEDERKETAGYF